MIFEKTGHGGDIYAQDIRYDFSANINPLGTPDSVRQAVIDSVNKIHNYPDPRCRLLIKRIAEYEGVPASYVMCGSGAAELIFSFCTASRPKKALELAPTFSEYSAALESVECHVERYTLNKENGFELTDAFLPVLQAERPDVVFLCNPNNPTGRQIEPVLLEKICLICAENNTRLFLDECFLDLSDDGGKSSMKAQLAQCPNLFILKAFTKNYGMAGLRLGYCLCSDRALLERMSKMTQVWNVSTPAQEAGIAALGEREFLARGKAIILEERKRLAEALTQLGFAVFHSDANYILFYCQAAIEEPLAERGILIRNCSNYYGLESGWYRIAVKLKEENEILISALRQIVGR